MLGLLLASCSSGGTPAGNHATTVPSTSSTAPKGTGARGGAGATGSTGPSSTTSSSVPAPGGQVVTPADVAGIVATDSAVNNRANAAFSIPLQDGHETCLQDTLDDLAFRGAQATGAKSSGGSFNQVPEQAYVPRESSYPAYFSVLAADVSKGEPKTNNLLTYVKLSSGASWKLDGVSEILGPTAAGVGVPAPALDAGGYATPLDPSGTDGLVMAPDKVAPAVAAAFDAQARSGKLPAGFSAEFGPKSEESPHAIATSWANLGSAAITFTTTPPPAAAAGVRPGTCPFPAWRLANGGALVVFPLFNRIELTFRATAGVAQPADRSLFGYLLAPGTYTAVTTLWSDMVVAVVPPAGSHSPIEVIGQASEPLAATGQAGGLITT